MKLRVHFIFLNNIPIGILFNIFVKISSMKSISKAEKTKEFIIKKAAPVFNRNGYIGTSLSDIVSVTGLTKGAIYGNFKNKEELALDSFRYNIKGMLLKIGGIMKSIESPVSRLYAISDFYRNYYEYCSDRGGCPVLNVGIDSNNTNPELLIKVRSTINKMRSSIAQIIEDGKNKNEIRKEVDSDVYSSLIYSLIEGAVFMSMTLQDGKHLNDMMNHFDLMIKNELIKK